MRTDDRFLSVLSGILYISVEDGDGRPGIGTGFHVGQNYIATARHVVASNTIKRIGRNDTSLQWSHDGFGGPPHLSSTYPELQIDRFDAPIYHPDPDVDVCLIKTYPAIGIDRVIRIGAWSCLSTEGMLLLRRVFVSGYPPIYGAARPQLVSFTGEVSAAFTPYGGDKSRRLVISGMARGGFSGAPVLSNENEHNTVCIGLVTESSTLEGKAHELGFICAISPFSIFRTMAAAGVEIPEVRQAFQHVDQRMLVG